MANYFSVDLHFPAPADDPLKSKRQHNTVVVTSLFLIWTTINAFIQMLGCCFAVKLISNRQPIYYSSSHSSRVSRALSVFKITLAAHCYWLLLTVMQNFILMNANKYRLIKLNYPVRVRRISESTRWLLIFLPLWEKGSGMIRISVAKGKTTLFGRFCKCILKMFCFPNYREAALLCPLFSQQRCSTLTSQTPMFFYVAAFCKHI